MMMMMMMIIKPKLLVDFLLTCQRKKMMFGIRRTSIVSVIPYCRRVVNGQHVSGRGSEVHVMCTCIYM